VIAIYVNFLQAAIMSSASEEVELDNRLGTLPLFRRVD